MKYLLLIPATVAMLGSVVLWLSLAHYDLPRKATVLTFLGAVSLQAGGVWVAGLIR